MKEDYTSTYLLILSVIIFADRMAKIYAQGCNFLFCIKKSMNYGAAFGILQHMQYATLFLIIISLILLPILIFFFFRAKSKLLKIALTMIAAGTIGNLIDRLVHGYVIDIISLNPFSFNIFNLADLSNTVGAILLVIFLLKKQK